MIPQFTRDGKRIPQVVSAEALGNMNLKATLLRGMLLKIASPGQGPTIEEIDHVLKWTENALISSAWGISRVFEQMQDTDGESSCAMLIAQLITIYEKRWGRRPACAPRP